MAQGRGVVRRVAVTVLALAAVAGSVVAGSVAVGATALPARAATPNRAAVVVYVDGVVHTAKVTFSTDSISGLDALRSAGLDPSVRVFGGNGGAVCALAVGSQTIGCPADGSCLTCAAPDYWAYFRALAGATQYTYSVTGAGNTQVHDGDVEAWAWGTGATPAPFESFGDVWGADPPPTTTRPTTSPTTARRPPPSTSPATVGPLGTATTTAPASTSSVPSSAATPTTAKPAAAKPKPAGTSSSTTPVATSDPAARGTGGARKVATAPVVAHGRGGSPFGLIGFALVLALLVAAIVFARARRSSAARAR